jgi:hypothetical protein
VRLFFVALALAGCGRGVGTRCERLCRAEAECAERLQQENDTNGCIEACAELERDPARSRLLDDHTRCVNRATTCQEKLDCP